MQTQINEEKEIWSNAWASTVSSPWSIGQKKKNETLLTKHRFIHSRPTPCTLLTTNSLIHTWLTLCWPRTSSSTYDQAPRCQPHRCDEESWSLIHLKIQWTDPSNHRPGEHAVALNQWPEQDGKKKREERREEAATRVRWAIGFLWLWYHVANTKREGERERMKYCHFISLR